MSGIRRYKAGLKVNSASTVTAAIAGGDIATGTITATQLAADSVGSSELSAGIVPIDLTILCTKPAVAETLGVVTAPAAMTATKVKVRCGTLPTNPGDSFSLNVRNGVVGNLFASAQAFNRTPDVGGILKTSDISGNDGTTFTSGLTEVTGAGTFSIAGIDTLANGDAIYVGYSQVFAGIRIDMDGSNVNAEAATLAAHYWDGSAWQAVGNISDGTASVGAPFAQDGVITFDTPTDWRQKSINGTTMYWIRLTHNGAALTAGTAIDNADIVRDTGTYYDFTPDQNTTVAAGAELRVICTEVDSNADGLSVIIEGTNDF